jgi:hypothetical protein
MNDYSFGTDKADSIMHLRNEKKKKKKKGRKEGRKEGGCLKKVKCPRALTVLQTHVNEQVLSN